MPRYAASVVASRQAAASSAAPSALTGKFHTQRTQSHKNARGRRAINADDYWAHSVCVGTALSTFCARAMNLVLAVGKTLASGRYSAKRLPGTPTHGRLGDGRVTWTPTEATDGLRAASTPPRRAQARNAGAREGSRGGKRCAGIAGRRADPRPSQTIPQPAI